MPKHFSCYQQKNTRLLCYSWPDIYLLLLFLYFFLPPAISLRLDPFACECVSEHESKSAIPPLLPGLNIVSRALPFSVWYPWQHVLPWRAACPRWLCSPAHSSLFPFPLHYSQGHYHRRLPCFVSLLPTAYMCWCYSKHLTLLRFEYVSYFQSLYCWPFATVISPSVKQWLHPLSSY